MRWIVSIHWLHSPMEQLRSSSRPRLSAVQAFLAAGMVVGLLVGVLGMIFLPPRRDKLDIRSAITHLALHADSHSAIVVFRDGQESLLLVRKQ
jgi:hypothetical protein